jgi:hypothetical protein
VVVLFYSCEDKFPKQERPEKPEESHWRTTHQYFSVKVENVSVVPPYYTIEEIKKVESRRPLSMFRRQNHTDMSFHEYGHGSGSGVRRDGAGRYNFTFDWELSDGILSLTETDDKDPYGGLFLSYNRGAMEWVDWMVEEFSEDKMVLSMEESARMNGIYAGWNEIHTYRYTFERVKTE